MSLLSTIRSSLDEAEALAAQHFGVDRTEFRRSVQAQAAAAGAAINALFCHGAFGKSLREMRLSWSIEDFRDGMRRGAWECQSDRKGWTDAPGERLSDDSIMFDCLGYSPLDVLLFDCYRERENPSSIVIAGVALHYGATPDLMVQGPSALLHECALDGALEFARLLLDFGAEVNNVFIPEERTPLMQAALSGHADVVELLLSRGADPNYSAFDGVSAISLAVQYGHLEIAEKIRNRL